ncbi:putative transporter ADD1 (major facilitator superfamily) [Handroanthus impetiginosus]|uniref:Putative transporter ADD1 (Major facilitator superfamily) n=1 Tax=Handroanthus impetiginosus TaxID=429701 RepID=A0A2G9GPS1_9LAMI|nr:putative transporter ADD1 (major facilitator superfamily) [Handroanthus impetiginosus]
MPLVGNLCDTYGRKVMITVPMTLSIFPLVILAYSGAKYYFYGYYVLRTLIAMATGSVHFLALAYVADNAPDSRRAAAFGIMSGLASSSFVFGNFPARFLSTSATFQSFMNNSICGRSTETDCLLEKAPSKKWKLFKTLPSVDDIICLLRTSPNFSKAAVVAFFVNVADVGLYASLMLRYFSLHGLLHDCSLFKSIDIGDLIIREKGFGFALTCFCLTTMQYYLKAQFHFNKNQFEDLMIINGIAGSISQFQLILMPVLTPLIGEEKMLPLGLFSSYVHRILYGFAWAPWVPNAAAVISVVATFALPCLRSAASKQAGPSICSFANIVSLLVFSPLTVLFLSDHALFHFTGVSIMRSSLASMIAFLQRIVIRPPPSPAKNSSNISSSSTSETLV